MALVLMGVGATMTWKPIWRSREVKEGYERKEAREKVREVR